jgi:alkaline phosphatase D
MPDFSRRSFLKSAAALAAWSVLPRPSDAALRRVVKLTGYPFACGIASGDPTPTGVVLWTRLAPEPLTGGGMPDENVEVSWQIAHDEGMTKVVQKGTAVASPELAHSVHVEAEGLEPGRGYFYQFKVGNETSPVGRTRTAPAAGSTPERLRFAFASCQHYESGLYTAYEHMAKAPLDLIVHLGDYIYDGAGKDGQVRKHVGPRLTTLSDYRNRHAQYKTDEHLQAAHVAFPWVVTFDDHEVENNWADEHSEKGTDPAKFLKQRAAAFQGYYEHMPLRRSAYPKGPDIQIYRRVSFGSLAEFFVLDTRQYRTPQPCDAKAVWPCPGALDPKATLLGAAQEKWLFDGLAGSKAGWNVLAQQVMMAPADKRPGEKEGRSMDQWPGYEVDRRRVLGFLEKAAVRNPVVITGDIHSNWANDLHVGDPDTPVVATEYVGTSISSSGDGGQREDYAKAMTSENPFVKFFNGERGFVQCEVTPGLWRSEYQVVPVVSKPGAPLITRATFVTESGKPGVQKG